MIVSGLEFSLTFILTELFDTKKSVYIPIGPKFLTLES